MDPTESAMGERHPDDTPQREPADDLEPTTELPDRVLGELYALLEEVPTPDAGPKPVAGINLVGLTDEWLARRATVLERHANFDPRPAASPPF
jgi:hypothetical protein